MKLIVCLAVFVAAASAGGYGYSAEVPLIRKPFIPIVHLVGKTDNAGNYNFDSEGGDGTKISETGGLRVIGGKTGATKAGTYSWTSPEGQTFSLSYTADEFGFHPVASHLPTPPPVPEEIARVLPTLPKHKEPESYAHVHQKPLTFLAGPPAPLMPAHVMTAMPAPVGPPATPEFAPLVPILAGPPAAPLRTDVETPEFVIHSDHAKTFFRIGA